MTFLSKDIVFINHVTSYPISSLCFHNKKADGLITFYSLIDNDADLVENDTPDEQMSKINIELNHDPDGYLLWVPQIYQQQFLSFLPEFIHTAYENEELNFDNGGISETFILHQFNDGLLVECIDPECFSSVFQNCFHTFMNDHNIFNTDIPTIHDFFYIQQHHMYSHIQHLKDTEEGSVMLHILDSHQLQYYISPQ